MSHHIIELQNVSYTYPDGTAALRSVGFRITHGESVALIGANGAGKSTLLLHLNGLLLPRTGTIRIGDVPLTASTLQTIRRTVGMVFQDADDQLFMPTVKEDVAFGPLNLGLPPEEIDRRVAETLAFVGATGLQDRPPHHLSAGEKRNVALATVLAMHPDILVMDEPSSSLDPWARRRLIELLSSFTHTKIIATHDLDLVLDVCRRTIVLHEGTVQADGPTFEIFQNDELLARNRLEKPLRLQACPVCREKR
ncbi:MAG: ABC transporter ATP-binding protein [Desulfobacteraceae bacterium]|nr:MAG: ABC transporter ATP-binding protein [Desulfobacteraceae bacterium]